MLKLGFLSPHSACSWTLKGQGTLVGLTATAPQPTFLSSLSKADRLGLLCATRQGYRI